MAYHLLETIDSWSSGKQISRVSKVFQLFHGGAVPVASYVYGETSSGNTHYHFPAMSLRERLSYSLQ